MIDPGGVCPTTSWVWRWVFSPRRVRTKEKNFRKFRTAEIKHGRSWALDFNGVDRGRWIDGLIDTWTFLSVSGLFGQKNILIHSIHSI